MTPECTAAWRNYECELALDTGYELRIQDAFEAGWHAATEAAVQATALSLEATITSVNTTHSAPAPSVGHVCGGSPTGRKPRLCWICGQALPHDCVGSAQPIADRLDGFALLSDAQVIHGPPLEVEVETNFAAAELRGCDRRCQAICSCSEYAGRKWPIGTPDETVYGSAYSTADEWHLRLRAARTHRGLTLDALARRLDPPRTRKDISAMEHGRRGLSVELCAQLADALDCDRLWLAGWTLEGAP